jgi:hypothetical protein
MAGLSCSYGNICTSSGAMALCKNGFWEWQPVACGG